MVNDRTKARGSATPSWALLAAAYLRVTGRPRESMAKHLLFVVQFVGAEISRAPYL